jgi:hypothetical protein
MMMSFVSGLLFTHSHGLVRRNRFENRVTLKLQKQPQDLPDARFVIDEKDAEWVLLGQVKPSCRVERATEVAGPSSSTSNLKGP